jgi:hypothetical protein
MTVMAEWAAEQSGETLTRLGSSAWRERGEGSDITGAVVTADVLLTQKAIARRVVQAKGADYVATMARAVDAMIARAGGVPPALSA